MIITYKSLIENGAPADQAVKFQELFPEGAEVNLENLDIVLKANLNIDGLARQFLKGEALAEYEKIRNSAYAEYEKIRDSAYEEYKKVHDSAYAEYEKIRNSAYAEYEKVRNSAYAEYEKIRDFACEEYKKVSDSACAECKKISDLARADFQRKRVEAFQNAIKIKEGDKKTARNGLKKEDW